MRAWDSLASTPSGYPSTHAAPNGLILVQGRQDDCVCRALRMQHVTRVSCWVSVGVCSNAYCTPLRSPLCLSTLVYKAVWLVQT